MKYALIPTITFKKGTPSRRRRLMLQINQVIWFKHGDDIQKAIERATMASLIYGTGGVSVSWDNTDACISGLNIENYKQWAGK